MRCDGVDSIDGITAQHSLSARGGIAAAALPPWDFLVCPHKETQPTSVNSSIISFF